MLGDAQLDVPAAGGLAPGNGLGHVCEEVGSRRRRVDARAGDPRAEMGGHRHIGREGDDVRAHGQSREPGQGAAERLLARGRLRVALLERLGQLWCLHATSRRPEGRGARTDPFALGARIREALPLRARLDPERVAKRLHLGRRQERAVIHGIPRHGQSPALDRLGQHHARLPGVSPRLREGLQDLDDVVAAHVGDRGLERFVREMREGPVDLGGELSIPQGRQGLADRPRRLAQERLKLRVGHRLEPLAEALASGLSEQSFETASPAQLDHMPARSVEPPGELARPAVGRDAIEALAIDVHHPQDVTERAERLLEESFPDVALVELRISHHRDEALGRACLPVVLDIA